MPRIPQRTKNRRRRIACRYAIQHVDGTFWARAYDQTGTRYVEADIHGERREAVAKVARSRVNKSYSAEENQ